MPIGTGRQEKLVTLIMVFVVAGVACYGGCQRAPTNRQSQQNTTRDFDHTFEPFLAHDVKTGEYLGVVITECREWETKKPISYKIRLQSGTIIERPAGSITIDSP
jgi:hypothetical protein